jgi:hypothetical protein
VQLGRQDKIFSIFVTYVVLDSPCGQTTGRNIVGPILKTSRCSSQGFDLFAAKKFTSVVSLTGYLVSPEYSSLLKTRI